MSTVYPLPALRALALHAQALTTANGEEPAPTPAAIRALVEQLLTVQIDTLQMVQRAQYVTIWARLGRYDTADLDRLIYSDEERVLFEYWGHAASIIPLAHYRCRIPSMMRAREHPSHRWEKWMRVPTNRETYEHVLSRITTEGRLRAADFEHQRDERGQWWDWKPAKTALEYYFDCGILMIADRVNFQRVYDLAERVLPDWVDTSPPTRDEALRFIVESSARALGVSRAVQVAEYAYLKRGTAKPVVDALLKDGVLLPITGQLADGSEADLVIHRDNLPLLEQASNGAINPARTTFLTPFDSLFWARGRDADLWQFQQVLEAYKKPHDRIWGYFCLPILHRDRLVGRFDPKLERKEGVLALRALHLEPGIEPDDELVRDVAAAMRDFLAFHDAAEVVIEKSNPPEFGRKLAAALT